jgi:hypothetical protein
MPGVSSFFAKATGTSSKGSTESERVEGAKGEFEEEEEGAEKGGGGMK